MKKENSNRGDKKPKTKIIITPHYVGTEKADTVIKDIIADEIKKKIEKTA